MTLTWQTEDHGGSATPQLRLISIFLAGLLCASLAYLAATSRLQIIERIFNDQAPVTMVVDPRETPDPPPRTQVPTQPPASTVTAPVDSPQAPITPETPTLLAAAPGPAPAPVLANATFLDQPSGRDFERYFPTRALARGQSGRVVLECDVDVDGRVSCAIISEDPVGWGFGAASLRAASHFRVAPATADGVATAGGRLRVPMMWRAR